MAGVLARALEGVQAKGTGKSTVERGSVFFLPFLLHNSIRAAERDASACPPLVDEWLQSRRVLTHAIPGKHFTATFGTPPPPQKKKR